MSWCGIESVNCLIAGSKLKGKFMLLTATFWIVKNICFWHVDEFWETFLHVSTLNFRLAGRQGADFFVAQAFECILNRIYCSQCQAVAVLAISSVRSKRSFSSPVWRDSCTIATQNGSKRSQWNQSENEEGNLFYLKSQASPSKSAKRSLSAGLSCCLPGSPLCSGSPKNFAERAAGHGEVLRNPVAGPACPPPFAVPSCVLDIGQISWICFLSRHRHFFGGTSSLGLEGHYDHGRFIHWYKFSNNQSFNMYSVCWPSCRWFWRAWRTGAVCRGVL